MKYHPPTAEVSKSTGHCGRKSRTIGVAVSRLTSALGLLALVLTAGVATAARAEEIADGIVTLRVGEVGEPLALIAGIDKGFFAQYKLAVKTVPLSGGPALISATIGGSTDLNYGDVFSWVAALNNGFKVKLVQSSNGSDASPNLAEGWSTLLVSPASDIKTAADLTGKKIGIAPTQLTQLMVSLWIDRHGGDSKAVTFVPVTPYLAMAAALKGGHVDAILDVDPFTQRDRKQNGFVVLGVPSREASAGASLAGYYATDAWLDKQGDVVRRFVSAYRKAADWANQAGADEKAAVIAKYGAVDLKALQAEVPGVVQNFHYFRFDGGPINVAATQAWVDLAVQYHLLQKSFPIKDELYPTATAQTVE
jgi:ABC-type nitrate/sulfonate/bicarbonate transport system substrate-binding protein